MAEYDIIIKGGTIVDGTRTPRYVGDLGIKDGKIARIGGLRTSQAATVLDASGLIVAPGFVDLHTHYEAQVHWDPYCTNSGWHGVTSVIVGNCGFGFAPCAPNEKDQDRLMLALTRNEAIPFQAMKLGMHWDWVNFPEFLDSMARIPKGVNLLSYVPLTPIYAWVMGYDEAKKRRPTEAELNEMCRVLGEGLDAGGCGWTAQVLGPTSIQRDYDSTPMITDLMTEEEILAFARVLGERGEGTIELAYYEGLISDTGSENRGLDDTATKFIEQVAAVSGRPLLYQTVTPNANDPEGHRQRLRWLEDCAAKGLRIFGQGQTLREPLELTFEDWNLFDDSPMWSQVTVGTSSERLAKMRDPEMRAGLRAEWDSGARPNPAIEGSAAGLIVKGVKHGESERYVGQSIGDIAQKENRHVIDVLLDIVVADDLQTELVAPFGRDNPQYTAEVMQSPYVVSGMSDGGAHVKFSPGGSYTTDILTWLVRDEGLLSLEEAHYKLSYLNAFAGGLRDRGYLREGAAADVVVYDLDKLELGTTQVAHDLPGGDWRRVQKPVGYRWTLVNGQVTLEDGEPTGTLSGKLLRHGAA